MAAHFTECQSLRDFMENGPVDRVFLSTLHLKCSIFHYIGLLIGLFNFGEMVAGVI